jgi:hypothetical protein
MTLVGYSAPHAHTKQFRHDTRVYNVILSIIDISIPSSDHSTYLEKS